MTNKSEEALIEEARRCDNCLCWLEHCESECCNSFSFRLTPRRNVFYSQDEVRIRVHITPDFRKYFELHGAKIEGNIVVFHKDNCDISPSRLFVTMRCTALHEDFLCRLHTEGKPDCCKNLSLETAQDGMYGITPRCLFAYKLKTLSGL